MANGDNVSLPPIAIDSTPLLDEVVGALRHSDGLSSFDILAPVKGSTSDVSNKYEDDAFDFFTDKSVLALLKKRNIRYVEVELEEKLPVVAIGGYAFVRRGTRRDTREEIAAKIMKDSIDCGDVRRNKRVIREALIWDIIKHRNILPFVGYAITEDGRPALVSPYQHCGRLSASEHASLPITTKLDLLLDVTKAVSYLHHHEKHVVHGDIRADNVLVSSIDPPRALLCDFGISTAENFNLEFHTLMMQTHRKWTPYEFQKSVEKVPASQQSDIYALGCLILEVLSGRTPFHGCGEYEIYKLIEANEHPKFPTDIHIDDEYKALMKLCWAVKPDDRPTADVVLSELRHLRASLDTSRL